MEKIIVKRGREQRSPQTPAVTGFIARGESGCTTAFICTRRASNYVSPEPPLTYRGNSHIRQSFFLFFFSNSFLLRDIRVYSVATAIIGHGIFIDTLYIYIISYMCAHFANLKKEKKMAKNPHQHWNEANLKSMRGEARWIDGKGARTVSVLPSCPLAFLPPHPPNPRQH